MKNNIRIFWVLSMCMIGGFVFSHLSTQTRGGKTNTALIQKHVLSPTPGIPKKITIPSLSVSARVEQVGLDTNGRMGVPTQAMDTAWYTLGARPGEVGNAVIDGHLDTPSGAPAVFWNLSHMHVADDIAVEDETGRTFHFHVTQIASYPQDNFPLQLVFGPTRMSQLNIITCSGSWDKQIHSYSQRTVVFSQLVH